MDHPERLMTPPVTLEVKYFGGVKDFNHFESTGLQHFLMTMETAKGSVGESDLAAYEKVQAACFFRPSALRCSLKCFQFTAEFGMEG